MQWKILSINIPRFRAETRPFLFSVPQLKEVVLKSGKVLRADVCIIGAGEVSSLKIFLFCQVFFCHSASYLTCFGVCTSAGSVPATSFLKQSGIHLDSKGFITVNKVLYKSRRAWEKNMTSSHLCHFLPLNLVLICRRCRQTSMGSLLEGTWWCFPSHNATTRRWTSLTGRWLMYTVSAPQLQAAGLKAGTVKSSKINSSLLFLSILADRQGGSAQHDGQNHWDQNCALLLVGHVWEDNPLCRLERLCFCLRLQPLREVHNTNKPTFTTGVSLNSFCS